VIRRTFSHGFSPCTRKNAFSRFCGYFFSGNALFSEMTRFFFEKNAVFGFFRLN